MDSKTRMNDFAELLNDLILSPSRKKKIDLLKNFFCKSNLKDKGWAFCILTNRMDRKFVSVKELKELIIENSDEDLFRFSYDYVGDLAETISLLWESNNENNTKINLHEFMEIFSNFDHKNKLKTKLKYFLDRSSENQRYTIIKILTGGLRVGVSNGLIKEALKLSGVREKSEIEEFWHGFKLPCTDLFEWLDGKELPKYINRKKLFNSFMLANNYNSNEFKSYKTDDYIAEFKWDGIRAQIIFSEDGKIFSRNGEDITNSFCDINTFIKGYFVVDGEIVVKKNNKILSFNHLQKRIGRKNPSKKLIEDYPIHFIAYDILFYTSVDCRALSLIERKKYLNRFIDICKFNNISTSSLIKFSSWDQLQNIKETSLNNHIEGVIIKKKTSLYKKGRVVDGWYKWKRNPFSVDFIIMYAQRGHGKRSSFYSDFTFGCWIDEQFTKLVPVGKAYSGYTNDELKSLDRWVRNNTVERFGPVRSLKPGLVVEVSFDNINYSSRHKSGVALRFPRFSRIRWDKPISQVCSLKYIKDLIN